MKKSLKVTLLSLCGIVAVLLAAVLVFVGIYFTRIQTMNSIEKLSDYDDGYNLYRMEVKYDYSLDDVINYGIKDNQTMIDAILKDALPLLPVKIEAPSFGCTAFTLTDADGDVHMGRNYDFKNNTSAMLVYCAPKNGYRSVATAALDNVSANAPDESAKMKLASLTAPYICLDGLNEKGVSIAVLTLDSDPVHQSTGKLSPPRHPPCAGSCGEHGGGSGAAPRLRHVFASSGRDYHFYITDATGDGRVVEYDCESETRSLWRCPSTPSPTSMDLQGQGAPNQKTASTAWPGALRRCAGSL
ncbi:MAG: linear amide C-N hydrolase [Christensenellales bacterium]